MTKQSFPIPEGCKVVTVEQIGNQIITTFEPVFKRGDVLINNEKDHICIFDKNHWDNIGFYEIVAFRFGKITKPDNSIFGRLFHYRHATLEEAQRLWDALAKEGKRWNPETMQVEPIKKERWRAEYGCVYFYFNYDFVVSTTKEYKFNTDDICYNLGNYFRTKAQAQRAEDRLKAELDKFWEEELR